GVRGGDGGDGQQVAVGVEVVTGEVGVGRYAGAGGEVVAHGHGRPVAGGVAGVDAHPAAPLSLAVAHRVGEGEGARPPGRHGQAGGSLPPHVQVGEHADDLVDGEGVAVGVRVVGQHVQVGTLADHDLGAVVARRRRHV